MGNVLRWALVGIVLLNAIYFVWKAFGERDDELARPADEGATSAPRLSLMAEANAVVVREGDRETRSAALVKGCPAIGVQDGALASEIQGGLEARGIESDLQAGGTRESVAYWVYIPALENRQVAARRLRELHAKGIDSFVVSSGVDANAISLGTFTNRDSAVGVQNRLRSAGYDTVVREQSFSRQLTWVVLRSPDAQGYLELLPQGALRSALLERRTCP